VIVGAKESPGVDLTSLFAGELQEFTSSKYHRGEGPTARGWQSDERRKLKELSRIHAFCLLRNAAHPLAHEAPDGND
jgi:hypothetical protein